MDVIRRNGIRFVAMSKGSVVTNTLEPIDEVHERNGLLAYLVYVANHIYLVGKVDFGLKLHHDEDYKKSELSVKCLLFSF